MLRVEECVSTSRISPSLTRSLARASESSVSLFMLLTCSIALLPSSKVMKAPHAKARLTVPFILAPSAGGGSLLAPASLLPPFLLLLGPLPALMTQYTI